MLSSHQSIALASRKHCFCITKALLLSCRDAACRVTGLCFPLPRTRRVALLDHAFPYHEPAKPCYWFFFPPPKTLPAALLDFVFPHQQRGTQRPYIITKRNSCFRSFCLHLLKKTEKNLHIRYKCSNFAAFSGMRGSHRAPHSFVNGV